MIIGSLKGPPVASPVSSAVAKAVHGGESGAVLAYKATFHDSMDAEVANNSEVSSFSRTGTAFMLDHESVLRYCKKHELRFANARRVENLLAGPTDTLATETVTLARAGDYTFSFTGTGTVTFTGTAGATGTLGSGTDRRYGKTFTGLSAGTVICTVSGDVREAMLEEVTGQSNKAPAEYVSSGVGTGPNVLNDPTFEVDDTTETGSESEWLWAGSQFEITGGAIRATGSAVWLVQTDWMCDIGKTYRVRFDVVAGAQLNASLGGQTIPAVGGKADKVVQATSATSLGMLSNAGAEFTAWDNVHIERIDHGANVDGVKYFDTTNGNSLDGDVVTAGTGTPLTDTYVLVEPQATNLLTYSEDWTTGWTQSDITLAGADNKTIRNVANANPHKLAKFSVIPNDTNLYTVWCDVEDAGGQYMLIAVGGAEGYTSRTVVFDLSAGTVARAPSVVSLQGRASIRQNPDGSYRCILNIKNNASGSAREVSFACAYAYDGIVANEVLVNTTPADHFRLLRAQCEGNGVRTSYVKTEASTVSRVADELQVAPSPAAGVGDFTLLIETRTPFDKITLTAQRLLQSDPGEAINKADVTIYASAGGHWIEAYFRNGSNTVNYVGNYIGGFDADADHKIGIRIASGVLRVWVDGVEVTAYTKVDNASFTMATIDFQNISRSVRDYCIYSEALTDAQMGVLTS